MKNLKRNLMAIALVLVSGALMATGNLKVNIIPAENNKAMVNISNTAQSQFEIELKNEFGEMIYYKQTNSPVISYSKLYDFAMLEDGNYIFEVKVNNEKEVTDLKINNGNVLIMDTRKEVEPFFTVNENRLEISYLNYAQEEMKIYVYDKRTNELLYEKKLEPSFALNYGLDFSNLNKGKYDAVLAGENNFYEYAVTVE
ncbi:MAG: hypothetical protein LC658_13700 [Bacteroidales bacterium]|nr:hypothetical protein [Bacteroidales bacterium]